MIKIFQKVFCVGIKSETLPEFQNTDTIPALHQKIFKIFGRSLAIRHVDAGSCNGCELELQALNNPYYNIEGYGLHFVASPRHADILLVTGPVSVNMEQALTKAYQAVPNPKWVVALGDCGSCGGIFGESYACRGAINNVIPVDATIKGCPPKPNDILKGILSMIMLKEPSRAI